MKIKDIAKAAGVSTATVSNVINGNHNKVSEETIKRVMQIVEENNYNPSATARSLARKESRIIGVVMPNLSPVEPFSISPYYTQILAMLEKYVRNKGYYLMVRSVGKCEEIVPVFSTWNVDGMIILGAFRDEVPELETKLKKVPTVYIDTYASDLNIANIGIDDYKGGYLAARYLMGKGHREIAFVGPNVDSPGVIKQRFKGFSDALAEKNIQITSDNIFESLTMFEQGVEAGRKIAFSKKKFTAVVSMSDILAFGVMEGLKLSGLKVPDDISVIGFDNLPECRYSNPQLTTVSQNLEKKASDAGDALFRMIESKEMISVNEIVDVEIVERQSVREVYN
ncbi:MAG: LacI family DNA-binding transcriptional regulator [Lachnospiraceae bacterium]|nr:LacI family DNA-binding transcriptional regulator [Lachnospiraceae bacterium]